MEKTRKPRVKDRHHRKPRSLGGTNDARNISIVDQTKHRAYHTLFQNMTPHEIARLLTEVWVDPDYTIIAVKKRNNPIKE